MGSGDATLDWLWWGRSRFASEVYRVVSYCKAALWPAADGGRGLAATCAYANAITKSNGAVRTAVPMTCLSRRVEWGEWGRVEGEWGGVGVVGGKRVRVRRKVARRGAGLVLRYGVSPTYIYR
ncbi:unnamed protein product, partial [Iphiclides podalirius]